jgi:magnesium transporter
MIKTYLFTQTETREDVSLENWQSLVADDCKLLWVDVRSVTQGDMDLLRQAFDLHDLALESVLDGYRRPHLYEFADHFYVNMTTMKEARSGTGLKPTELHLFVGAKFIITATRESSSKAADEALAEFTGTPGLCSRGPLYAVYLLAEDLVETYYPIVEKLDNKADELETALLDKADKKSLKINLDLKHEAFELRKLLAPQRDIFNDLSRRVTKGESALYFQDVYNRMNRIFDMLDTIREILVSNLDIYLSSVSNRLNDIMKVLTVLAVILGVFSFLTGWFGMNVFQEGSLKKPVEEVILWSVGIGGVITAVLMYWFHRKGWV